MPIDLGLARVISLLSKLGSPQLKSNYIHVAGTNGKGSVCAYLSSILLSSTKDFKVGKFTSPHLIYRHDCITLNNNPVKLDLFRQIEDSVIQLNKEHSIGCTEFEILTIVAFKIFELEQVDLAVLEVGLGGRLDATNIVPAAKIKENTIIEKGVLATGITKIGKDHESFLGNTLREIAFEKSGIIKSEIVNVVDGTNEIEVLEVVDKTSKELNSSNIKVLSNSNEIDTSWGVINREESPLKGGYQLQNLSVSLKILELVFPLLENSYKNHIFPSKPNIIEGIQSTSWPGRLQTLTLKYNKTESLTILLDGAHNAQSAKELRNYLSSIYENQSITFVIAFTKGKDIDELLKELQINENDKVIITQFGGIDGMPWIKATEAIDIEKIVANYTKKIKTYLNHSELFESIKNDENVVVCGSLYLVGEVLKLNSDNQ